MGVNIGAFISPLTVSWLRTHYGWSIAFMSAAVAMVLSLVTFITFKRYVADADSKVNQSAIESKTIPAGEVRSRVITLLAILNQCVFQDVCTNSCTIDALVHAPLESHP